MKTRIEHGSTHVTLICSPAMANAIGSAIVAASDEIEEDYSTFTPQRFKENQHFLRIGRALEEGQQFEEEEPSDASP